MTAQGERVRQRVTDLVGDRLRVVGRLTVDDYEVVYQREDVASGYSDEDVEEIHREQVFEWLNRPYIEGLFDDIGELRCTTRWFEDVVVFLLLPDGGDHGIFVSVDRIDGIDVDAVESACAAVVTEG